MYEVLNALFDSILTDKADPTKVKVQQAVISAAVSQ